MQVMINQQEDEKQHQVDDGIAESLHGQAVVFASHHAQDIPEKADVQNTHTRQVQEPAHAGEVRQDGYGACPAPVQ